MVSFTHLRSIPLFYDEWCGLLGVDEVLNIYVEEIYEDTWAAQYKFSFDGALLERRDEERGQNDDYVRLEPPAGADAPRPAHAAAVLNYGGPRWHGDLEADRITDMVVPLSVADREHLVTMGLQSQEMLPYILGIIHSYVISEAVVQPDQFVVCRRLRVAYRLSIPHTDADDGEMENYDSVEFALAQRFDPAKPDGPLHESWLGPDLLGVKLNWPMDVVACHDYLFLADSGYRRGRGPSHIHIFQTRHEPG
jgi:hypothetical protein